MPAHPPSRPGGGVLALTGDPSLTDELARLAAAAGVALQVHGSTADVPGWLGWALVLVGGDLARGVVLAGLARRPGVVLVTADRDDTDVWQNAVSLGAEQVAVLPDLGPWVVERMAAAVEPASLAHVVGVIPGCGGAGASVLAAALAVGAACQGRPVLLADLDPLGAGADLTVGAHDVPGLRWPDLVAARGRLPAATVRDALPKVGTLAVLAWGPGPPVDLAPPCVDAVLSAAARVHGLVVLDLPRVPDAGSAVGLGRVDELLVVLPARLRAAAAAAALLSRLGPGCPPVSVVVRGATPGGPSARSLAQALGVPLTAQLRDEPHLERALAWGQLPGASGRGPLRRFVLHWLAQLDARTNA